MINSLKISDFKSIDNLKLDFTGLNLFAGVNSSGKSTIIQSLLCIAQNIIRPSGLNGELVELGEFSENKCIYSNKQEIVYEIKTDIRDFAIKFRKATDNTRLLFSMTKINEKIQDQFDRNDKLFSYISCNRVGPQDSYKKNVSLNDYIDPNGEYAISYLEYHGNDVIEDCLCRNRNDFTLLGQVNWWLDYIVNAEVSTESFAGTNLVKASYKMYDGVNIRPVNIGAGVSYLISIIITCLASAENAIIIIENPEIHLHPKAQSRLCEFLYFIAKNKRQLFIETHSDHIFNGFRVGISNKKMDKSIINLEFVYLNKEHTTECMKVEVGKYGKILNQCPDLFDQFDMDLNRMLGI